MSNLYRLSEVNGKPVRTLDAQSRANTLREIGELLLELSQSDAAEEVFEASGSNNHAPNPQCGNPNTYRPACAQNPPPMQGANTQQGNQPAFNPAMLMNMMQAMQSGNGTNQGNAQANPMNLLSMLGSMGGMGNMGGAGNPGYQQGGINPMSLLSMLGGMR